MSYDKKSHYNPKVDFERLLKSMKIHREQDLDMISKAISMLKLNGSKPEYNVLDAGCGYGTVTKDRFGDDNRFKVVAIDKDEDVIKTAREKFNAPNIKYEVLDSTNITEEKSPKFDIVFSSYMFHHIHPDKQKETLHKLWGVVNSPGILLVRSCDDGHHLHYPKDKNMNKFVKSTQKIPGSSDRKHGRRMYTEIKDAPKEPVYVDLEFEMYSTANMTKEERKDYFDVFHGNRSFYSDLIGETVEEEGKELQQYMKNLKQELREKIIEKENIIDCKSVPMLFARKE